MTAQTSTAPAHARRRVILAGLVVVGVAAAVLSFDTINSLAEAAGFSASHAFRIVGTGAHLTLRISWLVPVAVDAFGLLATMAWLTPTFTAEIREYARWIAIADIALSAVLNAMYHGMKAAGWDISACWPVVIGVGAIPPVFVALALHLGSMVMDQRAVPENVSAAPSTGTAEVATAGTEPVAPTGTPGGTNAPPSTGTSAGTSTARPAAPSTAPRTGTATKPRTAKKAGTSTAPERSLSDRLRTAAAEIQKAGSEVTGAALMKATGMDADPNGIARRIAREHNNAQRPPLHVVADDGENRQEAQA